VATADGATGRAAERRGVLAYGLHRAREQSGEGIGLGLALLATLACRLPSFMRPILDTDEATYASIAALMNAGGRLYGDGGVDNKFPGIFWIYAGTFDLFGRYAMQAVHAVALGFVVATGFVLAGIARRLASRRAGWLAALFYGVFTTVYYPKMLGANTEIFMMLPLAGSMLLSLPPGSARLSARRLAGAGALVAAACLFKQVAAVNLLVTGTLALRAQDGDRGRRDLLGRLGAMLLGFVLVFAIAAGLLALHGDLGGLWHWAVVRLISHYGPSAWHLGPLALRFAIGFLPFVAAALLLWLTTFAALVHRNRRRAPRSVSAIALWLGASMLGVVAGGHFFGHYFIQLVGPLAVLGAVELDALLGEATPERRARIAYAAAFLTVLPAVGFTYVAFVFEPVTEQIGPPKPDYPTVAAYVRDHTRPNDRIFVWGMSTPIYVGAGRLPATRFVGFLRGLARDQAEPPEHAWDSGPDVWPLLADDFAAHPPELLVDTSKANYFDFAAYPISRFPVLAGLVGERYVHEATVEGAQIYRRTGSPARTASR
jgi:hypothetical protein